MSFLEERDRRYSERFAALDHLLTRLEDTINEVDVRLTELEGFTRSLRDERQGIGVVLSFVLNVAALLIATLSIYLVEYRK